MKNTSKLLFGFLAVLFVTACGSKEVKPTIMTNGCPAWTMQGTASFNDGSIYGVGSVFIVRHPSLARPVRCAGSGTPAHGSTRPW